MAEKWLVAVTAGKWQMHGIEQAQKLGLKVVAIDADPSAEGFALADKHIVTQLDNHSEVIEQLRTLKIDLAGAVSFCSEAGMPLAGKLREVFNLPGPRSELSKALRDKSVQRSIWTEARVPGPKWWQQHDSHESVRKAITKEMLPAILKPADSSGSRGVAKIEKLEDDIESFIDEAFKFSKTGVVILESYMDGVEFTVETFGCNGTIHVLAVTEKSKVQGTRGTVARELATPERPADIIRRIEDSVKMAIEAMGYLEGPGHSEVILMNDGSVGVVEVAGRGGGFMVFDKLVPAVSGVNIAELTASQAVGLPVDLPLSRRSHALLRFIPSRAGTLKRVEGIDKANKIEGVEAGCLLAVGTELRSAAADGDRIAYILSSGKNLETVRLNADQAESLIKCVVEE